MRTKLYFIIIILVTTLQALAQRESLTFRETLELFKKHGAIVYTSDSQFENILKAEITFGEIYGEKDSLPESFEGLYIVEYIENNIPVFGSRPIVFDGFFLGAPIYPRRKGSRKRIEGGH